MANDLPPNEVYVRGSAALDRGFPLSADLIPGRWSTLCQVLSSTTINAFVHQSRQLVSHPLPNL